MRFFRNLFIVILLISSNLIEADQDLLQPKDVQKIMQQIFSQHVEKKQMTSPILKNSFKVYIDQFDPERIYLLESEVRPFLNLSDSEMNRIMTQYQKNEFSEYAILNDVIQKAIIRARQLRIELEKDKEDILKSSKSYDSQGNDEWRDPDLRRPFPKNVTELKDRIKGQLVKFIAEERSRYGESQIARYEAQTLKLYEKFIQAQENHYLFETALGIPLPKADKENLFILHVLKALAKSLDAHTTFYNAAEAYDMRVRLEKEFQGIGIVLKQIPEGGYIVTNLLDGSTASKSGLVKVNDFIVGIDGRELDNEPYDKVMGMLRGKNGTKVALTLKRAINEGSKKSEKIFNISLTRTPIVVHEDRVDTSFETFGNGIIGKLTLHAFYQSEDGISSEQDLRDAITKLQKIGNLRGLIIDLRENSGGFLSQAVKVAGLFITNGVVVISKYSSGEEHFYRDMDGKIVFDGPLVILTSKATASAAEIVAQALQDYGVAIVIGDEHTYGKGTIQSQTVTGEQGSAYFKVTVGKYYTVSGKTPQIQGVKADIIVPSQFVRDNLGEEYLDYPLEQDKIASAYNDSLSDIDQGLKPWYLRYYTPTLQHQTDLWRNMIPILKNNSTYRIAHNKEYQTFLNPTEKKGQFAGRKNSKASDLQMAEAVNVVKDMITIQSRLRGSNATEGMVKGRTGEERAGIAQEVQK